MSFQGTAAPKLSSLRSTVQPVCLLSVLLPEAFLHKRSQREMGHGIHFLFDLWT